jgi:hypothetical protein
MTKHYSALASLSLAMILAFSPMISYAKEKDAEVKTDTRVHVENMETNHGFFKNFWLPFGIWKKVMNHSEATSTATSTPPAKHVELKAAFLNSVKTFFTGLSASTTYRFTLTATDPSGHATSTALGLFTTR